MRNEKIVTWGIIIIIMVLLGSFIFSGSQIGAVGSAHDHANFMVFLDGEKINFAFPQYMVKAQEVHIEDMNGITIHKHAIGVTLGYFFKTLEFKFNEECFITDKKEKFCNEGYKKLRFYVNGNENLEYGDYEIINNDKYLISYGSSYEDIQKQLLFLSESEIED